MMSSSSPETEATPTLNPRFLVVSLGNPAPHHESVHSAGHVALIAAQQKLRSTQPAYTSLRFGKKATQTSLGPKYNFLQSPTQTNVTGPWLAKSHKEILANEGLSASDMGVVVLHDDLEEDFGVVKIRKWDRSHRGHNGVKSISASLQYTNKQKGAPWARISIGVGRPAKRDAATVSEFVLRPLSKFQKTVLVGKVTDSVLACLLELEEEWRRAIAAAVKE